MKTGLQRNLLIIDLLSVLFIVIISVFPSSFLRVVLGLPFLFLFPGYALLAALLPRRAPDDGIARLALSFGVSFIVVALAGLALNFTPWGIRLYPVLIVLTVITVISSVVAWFRQRAPSDAESPVPVIHQWFFNWKDAGLTGKILTSVLAVFILVAAGSLVYIIAVPPAGESFTEFYILGKDGRAQDYPVMLRNGEETVVTAVVACHENRSADYYLEIAADSMRRQIGGAFTLKNGEKWQGEAVFSLDAPGNGQKVEFILYKDGAAYRLYLLVDVM